MTPSRVVLTPISSPYPFKMWVAAYTGASQGISTPAKTAVTPVRTASSAPSGPSMIVR